MTNKRRNKGPEHIRDIIKDAREEWKRSIAEQVKNSERFRKLEASCPDCLQVVFLYIDGDPQYIRTLWLN